MSEVVGIPTLADIPVEKVLAGAAEAELSCVLVLGFTEDGDLYAAASSGSQATNVHLAELFKHNLFSGHYGPPVMLAR